MPDPADLELADALDKVLAVMSRRDLTDTEADLFDLIEAYAWQLRED